MKPPRPLSDLELLGAAKMRRALAERLVAALPDILGAAAVSLTVTVQDKPAEEPAPGTLKVVVPFSSYNYVAWGEVLGQMEEETQEEVVLAHVKEAVRASAVHQANYTAKVLHSREQREKAKEAAREAQVGQKPVGAVEPAAAGAAAEVREVRGGAEGDPSAPPLTPTRES